MFPPTATMNADQVESMLQMANDYTSHLQRELAGKCEEEGHRWDVATGRRRVEHVGGWSDASGRLGGSIGGSSEVYFARTCVRCGKAEKRDAVTKVVSPFA